MDAIAIYCADVGSIKNKKFGWASFADRKSEIGNSIEIFAEKIAQQIRNKKKVALGFECPLFVPVRQNPIEVNSARSGEGNRSWSAGAGTGALATGLIEVLWVMNRVNALLGHPPFAQLNWQRFFNAGPDSVFLWEAFVSSTGKGDGHCDDARIAVESFRESMSNLEDKDAIREDNVFSLVGAAALRSGWSKDLAILSEKCVVIKA